MHDCQTFVTLSQNNLLQNTYIFLKTRRRCGEMYRNLKQNLGWPKLCRVDDILLLYYIYFLIFSYRHIIIFSHISNISHWMYKLSVITRVILWMLNVDGQAVYIYDAKVFTNSSINAKLRGNKLLTTFQTVPGGAKIPNYLIGDPGYPLLPFCMKEYKSCANKSCYGLLVILLNVLLGALKQDGGFSPGR